MDLQAVSILLYLSSRSRSQILQSSNPARSAVDKFYRSRKSAFDLTRGDLSESSAVLRPEELDIKELGDMETVQTANMATICASILQADDVPLSEVHDHFLGAFVPPESGVLSTEVAGLLLQLKTHLAVDKYLEAQDEDAKNSVLSCYFPEDMEEQLKQLLHQDNSSLSDEERRFVADSRSRRSMIVEELRDEAKRSAFVNLPLTPQNWH